MEIDPTMISTESADGATRFTVGKWNGTGVVDEEAVTRERGATNPEQVPMVVAKKIEAPVTR